MRPYQESLGNGRRGCHNGLWRAGGSHGCTVIIDQSLEQSHSEANNEIQQNHNTRTPDSRLYVQSCQKTECCQKLTQN